VYTHWRDRELMREPPSWNEPSQEEIDERERWECDQADDERKYGDWNRERVEQLWGPNKEKLWSALTEQNNGS